MTVPSSPQDSAPNSIEKVKAYLKKEQEMEQVPEEVNPVSAEQRESELQRSPLTHVDREEPDMPSDFDEGPSHQTQTMASYTTVSKFKRRSDNYYETFIDDSLRAIGDLISVKKRLTGDVKAIRTETQKEKTLVEAEEKRAIELEASVSKELESAQSLEYQNAEMMKVLD